MMHKMQLDEEKRQAFGKLKEQEKKEEINIDLTGTTRQFHNTKTGVDMAKQGSDKSSYTELLFKAGERQLIFNKIIPNTLEKL